MTLNHMQKVKKLSTYLMVIFCGPSFDSSVIAFNALHVDRLFALFLIDRQTDRQTDKSIA